MPNIMSCQRVSHPVRVTRRLGFSRLLYWKSNYTNQAQLADVLRLKCDMIKDTSGIRVALGVLQQVHCVYK